MRMESTVFFSVANWYFIHYWKKVQYII